MTLNAHGNLYLQLWLQDRTLTTIITMPYAIFSEPIDMAKQAKVEITWRFA